MSGKLRVVTTGTGFFSRFHYNAWKRMRDAGLIDLVAICNRSRAHAVEFADHYGVPAIYQDIDRMLDAEQPDLIDIITPPETHRAYVTAAVERGIKVICQKPFTPNLETAEKLVRLIDEKNATVFIHENFRFHPWFPVIKDLIDDGKIGTPYEVIFWLRPGDGQGEAAYLHRQPYFQTMPRFLVHETAIHLIDTFRYLFGEVTDVYADLVKLNPVIAGEDAGLILFNFANGVRGVFDGNRLADHPADNRRLTLGEMRIEGSGGTVTLDGFGTIRLRAFDSNNWFEVPYEWRNIEHAGDAVYLTNRHIVDHILTGSPVMNTAADYLVNIRIEDAVYRSAERGCRIDLDAPSG